MNQKDLSQEVWKLHQAGMKTGHIALRLEISPSWVCKLVKRRGRPSRGPGRPPGASLPAEEVRRKSNVKVFCLRCDGVFITERDYDGRSLYRLCGNCRKYNAQIDAGALA